MTNKTTTGFPAKLFVKLSEDRGLPFYVADKNALDLVVLEEKGTKIATYKLVSVQHAVVEVKFKK